MIRYLTADYIFPISSPPIKNGIVVVNEGGFIIEVLKPNTEYQELKTEYFRGILCPGFINSHCHLELSYLKGKISEKKGLPEFIGEIEFTRGKFATYEIQKAIADAENEMLKNGIVGVGDICNSDSTFKQKSKERIKYHTFIEALGFHPEKADLAFGKCLELVEKFNLGFRSASLDLTGSSVAQTFAANLSGHSITPHSPYSASKKLLKKISDFALKNNSALSIHNQENEDENKMFLEGKGKILERLKLLSIDTSQWKPTGKNSLESIFPHLPNRNKILFVHNTFTTKNDIHFLKETKHALSLQIYFCFCPNANLYIENRLPDFQLFLDEDYKITVGTDSLASNWSLSILDELKTISMNVPQVPLNELLTWATINGAEFFGWEKELGTFEKGKKPGINWIKNIDPGLLGQGLINLKLTAESEVQKIC